MTHRFAPDAALELARPEAALEGLVLAPFPGVRYNPSKVGSLANVTAPPYDVIEDDAADALEASSPHNIVRLILPEHSRADGPNRYSGAARELEDWRSRGVLTTDAVPSLYVYEQSTADMVQRGLLGVAGLRPPHVEIILPHEDTMPGPVADRLSLLRATRANLEPIYLLYNGGGRTSEIIESAVEHPTVIDAVTPDGVRHRLWALSDRRAIAAIAADLAPRQALIADGHHRYATYLAYQQEMRASGGGNGPWDYGLSLLVDIEAYPPQLNPIHRAVHGLDIDDAVRAVDGLFTVRPLPANLGDMVSSLVQARSPHAFVLATGNAAYLLECASPERLSAGLRHINPDALRRLDATVLHEVLLAQLWQVEDSDTAVSYHHTADAAVRVAEKHAGTAVLMKPVTVDTVFDVTRAGARMPRKSTSFGPKPRTGLVMRSLDAG